MATIKKMTKKEMFAAIRAAYPVDAANHDEVIAFIDHEVELLNKKSTTTRKPSKEDEAKAALRGQIVSLFAANPDTLYTCTDIAKALNKLNGTDDLSSTRVNALLQPMLEDKGGNVRRTEDKRKAYFQLAKEEG